MNKSPRRVLAVALAATTMLSASGCKTPVVESLKLSKVNEHMPWHDADQPREGVPTRVIANWSDAVHYQQNKKPQRGFGGRLMFYDNEGNAPVLVDGELVVYAFNETGRAPTDNMPTRRYVFTATDLPKLMSQSELGASYSVWLPWDEETGGPKAEVSLVCRFQPNVGGVVISEQTRHDLPGAETPASIATAGQNPKIPEGVAFKSPIELASYHAPLNSGSAVATASGAETPVSSAPNQLNSTTIALPHSMRNLGSGMPVQTPLPRGSVQQSPIDLGAPAATSTEQPANGASSGTTPERSHGYRLQPLSSMRSDFPSSRSHPGAQPTLATGAASSMNSGLRSATQSYPPPMTVQEMTQQRPTAGGPQAAVSPQALSQGYGNHPLSGVPINPLVPIGSNSTGNASVSYQPL